MCVCTVCVCQCVCVCTGIIWNELIYIYANIVHTSSSFHPHTHTHMYTVWEPMVRKVDSITEGEKEEEEKIMEEREHNSPSIHVLVLKLLLQIFAHWTWRALSRPAWSARFLQHAVRL